MTLFHRFCVHALYTSLNLSDLLRLHRHENLPESSGFPEELPSKLVVCEFNVNLKLKSGVYFRLHELEGKKGFMYLKNMSITSDFCKEINIILQVKGQNLKLWGGNAHCSPCLKQALDEVSWKYHFNHSHAWLHFDLPVELNCVLLSDLVWAGMCGSNLKTYYLFSGVSKPSHYGSRGSYF